MIDDYLETNVDPAADGQKPQRLEIVVKSGESETKPEKKGFFSGMSTYLPSVLTASAVVAAAYLGSNALIDNDPPNVDIFGAVGKDIVYATESAITTDSVPVVPTNYELYFSAGKSEDPDGQIAHTQFEWYLETSTGDIMKPIKTCPEKKDNQQKRKRKESTKEEIVRCRSINITLPTAGLYILRLDVTDNHKCTWLRTKAFSDARCSISNTAYILLNAIEDFVPTITSTPIKANYVIGETLFVEITDFKTIDGRQPEIIWSINDLNYNSRDLRIPIDKELVNILGDELPMIIEINAIAKDSFGRQSKPVILTTNLTNQNQPLRTENVVISSTKDPNATTQPMDVSNDKYGLCNGSTSPVVLSASIKLDNMTDCNLPTKIITNGYGLRIDAESIISLPSTEIISFTSAASSGPDSQADGANGKNGVAAGTSGSSGLPGSPGGSGSKGDDADPIELKSALFSGELNIVNNGQNGGDGGDGADGGSGGNGAKGRSASQGYSIVSAVQGAVEMAEWADKVGQVGQPEMVGLQVRLF